MTSDARRYLGVDGGGTRTSFCLISAGGEVLGASEQPTTSYFRSEEGIALVGRILEQGIAAVTGERDAVDFAFFALPGYGEVSSDVAALDAAPRAVLGHDRYACDNDMVAGWAGSLAGSDGINVVAGTGSIAYGEHDGRRARAGGWGELFGDEGSAYWVATQGLNAFSRMSDGRLARGPLYTLLKEHLQLAGDLDVVSLVIEKWSGNRSSIAALSATVCEAARAEDAVATRILSDAADELVTLIETTTKLVGFTDQETVPVSYSGGMFSDEGFLTRFLAALQGQPAKFDLQRPLLDPALGAALYAAKYSGRPLSPSALHELTTSRA
jgi:N-acetylglucosamine kinase-like BadF-type ATPase